MTIKYVNSSESTLAAGIAAGATTLTVQAGHGARFPTIVAASGDFFYATLVDINGVREVIKVTEHQVGTDVFQVMERAADAISNGTPTAYAFLANDRVQARLPAAAIMAPDATTATSFQLDSANTGPRIKNNSAVLEARNAADAAYADVRCKVLTATDITAAGAVTGVTDLTVAGAVTGVTTLAASGALTIGGTSSIPIDNEATSDVIKACDHGTAANDEVVNVCYGTTTPPAAATTTEGTLWIKYVA